MMRGTPRTFVGSVAFRLEGPVCPHVAAEVRERLERMPGLASCDLDVGAGTLVVTAATPVDRADVVAVLDGAGCRVR